MILTQHDPLDQCHDDGAIQFRDILIFTELFHPYTVFGGTCQLLAHFLPDAICLFFGFLPTASVFCFQILIIIAVNDTISQILIERLQKHLRPLDFLAFPVEPFL